MVGLRAIFLLMAYHEITLQSVSEGRTKTGSEKFNSMIFAELSYSPLKLIEKAAVETPNFCRNPIRAYNFAVRNEVTSSNTS